MSELYNTQSTFTSKLNKFLENCCPNLRKTQLNIIPAIVYGMILSESSVSSNIAKNLKDEFSFVQLDSVIKRIRRFYNNKLFEPYAFYDSVISYVIKNYKKKHPDKRVHIIIDHMFSHNNYTVFMISMRVGTQGIPLWFRCFKGRPDCAYHESIIIEGINYVSSLFNNRFNLIFLGDRWFNSTNIMKVISSLGHTFNFRLKSNINVLFYDKKEGHHIWKKVDELKNYEYHSVFYKNVFLTDNKYDCTLVYSKRHDTDDPWIIVTNGDPKWAIKDYGYRFGGIESLFKNQKSNGFYIEAINNASETSFTNMYTLVCFSTLFLTILGADFSRNTRCYKNTKITTHKFYKNKGKVRVMSIFKTGLTLIKLAFNSFKYIRIPFSFKLYDI